MRFHRPRFLKRAVLALAVAGVAGALAPAALAATPVQPWVHTKGTQFVDASGDPVLLRGVDVQTGQGDGYGRDVAALGANVVRIVAPWSVFEPTAPASGVHHYDATQLRRLDEQVGWYQAHGVTVLIDFHQFNWSTYFEKNAEGIPAWFYSVTHAGDYAKAQQPKAIKDWYADKLGQSYYIAFARMMVKRYSQYPNVLGYEVFNEPQSGDMGETHAATQAVLSWEAPVVNAIRNADPYRSVFFMVRGGGDEGLAHADFSAFGSMDRLVMDFHDYYNGAYGSGWSSDGESWYPSWDLTHNQNFTNYHGTERALMQNIQVRINRTRELGIPLFVGEWGVRSDDSGAATYQTQMLDMLRKFGLSWARWPSSRFAIWTATRTLNSLGLTVQAELTGLQPNLSLTPANELAPSLSGFAQATQALTVDPGLWSGVPAPSVDLQWQRCDTSGASCADIAGATAKSYTATSADIGSTLRVRVTATSAAGSSSDETPPSDVVTPFTLTVAGLDAEVSPASGAVFISFTLNEAARTAILVRNSAGQIVKVLDKTTHPAGEVLKRWNRQLATGQVAPAGTYTIEVTATAGGETQKRSVKVTLQ